MRGRLIGDLPERTVHRSCFQRLALMILKTLEVEAAMMAPPCGDLNIYPAFRVLFTQ